LIDPCRLWLQQKRSLPLQSELAAAGTGETPPPAPEDESKPSRGPADGLHALLVEDQTIIALDTESMLRDLGATSVFSFTTADAAVGWLASATADIGILDISLGSSTSFPVADALHQRMVPFVFTTGYGDSGLIPERFLGVPIVRKPYTIEAFADAVAKCLRARRPDA
jgi:DNA-binding NtrC family response regulator